MPSPSQAAVARVRLHGLALMACTSVALLLAACANKNARGGLDVQADSSTPATTDEESQAVDGGEAVNMESEDGGQSTTRDAEQDASQPTVQDAQAHANDMDAAFTPAPEAAALDASSDAIADSYVPNPSADATPESGVGNDDAGPLDAATTNDANANDAGDAGDAGGQASCDLVVELRAHGGQVLEDHTPFVPPTGTAYEQFYFAPTWNEPMQVVRIDPLLPQDGVAKNVMLYMFENSNSVPGSHQANAGLQSSDATLLFSASAGSPPYTLPDDVGLRTLHGASARLSLEIHYEAPSTVADRSDRSGLRLCLTRQLRAHEAAFHWLGTQAIVGSGKFNAVGICTVPREAHVIATKPLMHLTGRYMRSELKRRNGTTATITDTAFWFGDETLTSVTPLSTEVVAKAGEVITTTCSYDSKGFITFGPSLADEMCYDFVLAWPVGSLHTGPGIVGGQNTCIDGF